MWPLVRKTLRDKCWVIVGWAVGMIALSVLTLSFYPSFSQDEGFDKVLEALPEQLQGVVGSVLAFKTIGGFIEAQVFDLRLPLFTVILGVVMAVNLTVSEEESGTLKTLQSLPISRTHVVLGKWIALGIITLLVCASAIPGILLGVSLINETVAVEKLIWAALLLWLVSFGIASFGFMVGLASGRKGLTVGASSLFAFYNIFVASLAPSVKSLQDLHHYGTLFYYFNNPKPILNPPSWWHLLVLMAACLVFVAIAIGMYNRRDLRAV